MRTWRRFSKVTSSLFWKLECCLVCKSWNNIISNSCLYQQVIIQREWNAIPIIYFFEKHKSKGRQTDYLHISGTAIPSFVIKMLPDCFPNITTLELSVTVDFQKEGTGRSERVDIEKFQESIQKWTHLRVLREQNYVYPTIATALLQKPTKLVKINLDMYDVDMGRPKGKNIKLLAEKKLLFLSALKNAPDLTSLQISNIPINLADLEMIHEATPKLNYLALLDFVLRIDDNSFKLKPDFKSVSNIQIKEHCNSLETFYMNLEGAFSFNSAKDDILNFQWLDYVSRKYTNLKKFAFMSNSPNVLPSRADAYDPYMLSILAACPELTDVRLLSWPLSKAVEKMVDQRTITGDQGHKEMLVGRETIRDKMVDFSKSPLAKLVTSLCIKTPDGFLEYRREVPENASVDPYYMAGSDPFDYYAKDDYERELRECSEGWSIENEAERVYIDDGRHDKMLEDDEGNMYPNPDYTIYDTLKRLTKLKKLEIKCMETVTQLEVLPKMLQSISTLESIMIDGIFIKCRKTSYNGEAAKKYMSPKALEEKAYPHVEFGIAPLYSKVNFNQPTKLKHLELQRMFIRDAVQFDRINRTFEDIMASSPDVESFKLDMECVAKKNDNFNGPDQDVLLLNFSRQTQLKKVDLRRLEEYSEKFQDIFISSSRDGQQDKHYYRFRKSANSPVAVSKETFAKEKFTVHLNLPKHPILINSTRL
ncbi:hypothetical protein MBANPS3_006358 [Mucor bainieri]